MATIETTTIDTVKFPRRLTLIQIEYNCMFCENPTKHCQIEYVYLVGKIGYIYCDNCKEANVAKDAVNNWNNNISYGKANYLKNKNIRVKRSKTGEIEDDWQLDNPLVDYDDDAHVRIHCYNPAQDVGKWYLMDELLELNPA